MMQEVTLNTMRSLGLPGTMLAFVLGMSAVCAGADAPRIRSTYVLGPDDQISIRAIEAEEISDKPVAIGPDGFLTIPLVGRIRASGLTIQELETEVRNRLKRYIQNPEVAVSVTEYRSQPVSVLGAVKNPGVHQLSGRKTLAEMLSMAGGLRSDAGYSIKITREMEWGRIPLPTASDDPTGKFSTAQVDVKRLLEAGVPEENILICPHDVISVPRAEMVYVIGEVTKSGGFVLEEREHVSVLQALALAGGLARYAAPGRAKILRLTKKGADRAEIPVDVGKIMSGRKPDVPLGADDILFVPTNVPKAASLRAVEAAISIGTGIAIWRR